jgi:hypothetical protein
MTSLIAQKTGNEKLLKEGRKTKGVEPQSCRKLGWLDDFMMEGTIKRFSALRRLFYYF